MADAESSSPQQQEGQKHKKRRLRGACDACRKRKIKCDSAIRPGIICSHCELTNSECTHDAPRLPTKKETQEAYIQSLEDRLEKMENFIRTLYPDSDLETLLDFPLSEVSDSFSSANDLTPGTSLNTFPELKYPKPHLSSSLISDGPGPETVNQSLDVGRADEEQDLSHVELADHLGKLFVEDKRFFGQASSYMFAHWTMHAKMEASGTPTQYPLDSNLLRRPLYWEMRPWELSFARSQQYTFVYPAPSLLDSLVSIYFEKSNIFIPVLHKPTFLRSLSSGLHLRDSSFGMTVLLVCAIASRFASDSRVILDDDISSLSSGWKYYSQVPNFKNHLFERTTLYDIQCYVLSTVYLLGTSMVHVAWPILGLGLRFAQEKGLHRRKGKREPTAEEELEKRVFWCLIVIDRWMSAFLGRPCAMQDEEFDLDDPAECDDECWETPDPKDAFKQPPGKPSKMTYFIWAIKLVKILGLAHRTLYATKKSKTLIGYIGNEWESQAVAELDSSMNRLKDSVPHFLRWNPENPDTTFFWQSIAFYTCFYHLQIQIHRPFLMKRSPISCTSLAICNNAGRSTAVVLEVALSRGAALFPSMYMSAFTAALVLLLTHWTYQPAETSFDSKTTMELVRKLLYVLKDGERTWHIAGRLCDLTQILGCLSDQRSNPQLKRRRESENVNSPVAQNQRDYQPAVSEQESFTGGILQKHIAAAKLEPPTLGSFAPSDSWDTNNSLSPQMGRIQSSYGQQQFATYLVDSNLSNAITQTVDSASFSPEANCPPSTQDAHILHSFDPHSQVHNFTEDPLGFEWESDDLFQMWANVPMNFSQNEWQDFLSVAMQP